MAKKKKDLEELRSNYEASRKAFEEAESERIAEFAKMLFSDEELRQKVLNIKTPDLKQTSKKWAEQLKRLAPYNPQ